MSALFAGAGASKLSPFGAGVDLITAKRKKATPTPPVANPQHGNAQRLQLRRQMPVTPAVRNLLA
jgi:hypothetical protein